MRNRVVVGLSSAVSALLIAGLLSCGSDSGSPTKPDPKPDPDPDPPLSHEWTPDVVGLPPADSAVLDSAAARYRALRMAGDAEAARNSLVAALASGWDRVAAAGVTIDGSTIQINFSDGVKTIIVTDETFDSGVGGQAGPMRDRSAPAGLQSAVVGSAGCTSVGGALANAGCAGAVVPSNQKLSVINSAAATSSTADAVSTQIRQNLSLLGWDDGDIEVRQSSGRYDRSFTPDEIFDQSDAGLVFMNAEGVVVSKGSGSPTSGDNVAFAMQAFNGGTYEEYQQHVSTERWAQYDQWQKDGRLIHAKVWSPTTQTMVDQVFIREDLLAEEIQLASNATVHFNVPESGRTGNLMGIVNAGAASATGWDGFISSSGGAGAVNQLISNMAGENGEAMTQAEALSLLQDQGLSTLTHAGGTTSLVVEAQSQDPLFLPTQVRFDAPGTCMAAGTASYDVEVSYSECPELDQSFQFIPGGSMSLTGIPPIGAEISFKAKDAAGTTVGTGRYDLELSGGPNDVDLCPCQGTLDIDISQIASVPGVDAGSQITGTIDYADASIPDGTFTVDVGNPGASVEVFGMPGEGTLSYTLEDGSGKVLGTSASQEVDLKCDGSQSSEASFGWLKFSPGRTWSNTDSLFLTGTSKDPARDPFTLSLTPEEDATQVGMVVSDTIQVVILAETEAGEPIDTLELEWVVEPGENDVEVNFETYGILIEATRDSIRANGWDTTTVTATVRWWQDDDTDEPTGSPIPGLTVWFFTDLGTFAGPGFEVTDAAGKAREMLISSTDGGIANIYAQTEAGLVSSEILGTGFQELLRVFITQREAPYDGSPCWNGQPVDPDYHCLRFNCVRRRVYVNQFEIFDDDAWRTFGTWYDFDWPVPGDTLRFLFEPDPSCIDPGDHPPNDEPFMSTAWIHYLYGDEYLAQISVKLTDAQQPMTQVLDVRIPLRDPRTPGATSPGIGLRPSPFDLSAPANYVLSGFKEFRE